MAYQITRPGASFEPLFVFEGQPLSLRGFDRDGMPRSALLAPPGESDGAIRTLSDRSEIAYSPAHHAAFGRFAARIDRN